MIVIVDYGMGNLGSIANMISRIGGESRTSSKKEDIKKAEKIILPGVGAFDNGMKNLKKLDLIPVIRQKVFVEKVPLLGICLGMQLLSLSSEEGKLKGLNLINAKTVRFKFDNSSLRIPHMGWNIVKLKKRANCYRA